MMDLYGNGLLLGEKTLDSLWMRQNLTMNNIANVDTPGFKSQYMTFENELAQKIRSALTVQKASMKNVARGIENMRPVFRRSTRKFPSFSSCHFFISFPASRFFLYLQQIFNALLGLFLLKKFF